MWFKRRKKSDQALSQSLKSLQSLLNENDRREPSLEGRDDGPEPPEDDVPAPRTPEALKPRAARRTGPPAEEEGAGHREPAPPDSASRWRDLNLTFDAEPVPPPRPRRQTDTADRQDADSETPPAKDGAEGEDAAEGVDESGAAPPETDPETEEVVLEASQPDEPAPAEAQADDPSLAEPGPDEPLPGPAAPDADDHPPRAPEPVEDRDAEDESAVALYEPDEDEWVAPRPPRLDVAPVDFESFSHRPLEEPAAAQEEDAEAVETLTISDTLEPPSLDEDEDVAVLEEPSLPPFEAPDSGDAPAEAAAPTEGNDDADRQEDQLHLELEPAHGNAEDDIPTLTEVVYVPDAAPAPDADDTTEPGPLELEPADTPPDEDAAPGSVEWCIEQLRTRLQLMEIDPLSPEQEAELRDTLSELLDELKYPDTGD